MIEYLGIIFSFLFAIGLTAFLLFLPKVLSPKMPNVLKSAPFECGKTPFGLPSGQIPVHFYIVAMLFIIFDVELVFLFPWAITFREMGLFGLGEMACFMGFVILGFCYAWKKGALEWE